MPYRLAAAALAMLAMPARADIPLMAIGLPFAPETPNPVAATHPLYHGIAIGEIEGLPATIGSSKLNFIHAAKRSSVNAGLRDSLAQMNLLAPADQTANARLAVAWGGSQVPFRIATHNRATATLHYRLTRISDARILFDRDITTAVEGGGVDASMRDNGIVRAAIATNFASAANCLDRVATGSAPDDCALVPRFSVSVERR